MGLRISKTNNALKLMRFIESSMVRHPKNPAINRMMDMEAKTAASRHAVTPLEKLGVDAIFEKKRLLNGKCVIRKINGTQNKELI